MRLHLVIFRSRKSESEFTRDSSLSCTYFSISLRRSRGKCLESGSSTGNGISVPRYGDGLHHALPSQHVLAHDLVGVGSATRTIALWTIPHNIQQVDKPPIREHLVLLDELLAPGPVDVKETVF